MKKYDSTKNSLEGGVKEREGAMKKRELREKSKEYFTLKSKGKINDGTLRSDVMLLTKANDDRAEGRYKSSLDELKDAYRRVDNRRESYIKGFENEPYDEGKQKEGLKMLRAIDVRVERLVRAAKEKDPDLAYRAATFGEKVQEGIYRMQDDMYKTQGGAWGKVKRTLEHMLGHKRVSAVIAIAGILGGIFFLSSNITGKVIGGTAQTNSNAIGAVLIVIGLVAGFFWTRKR